MKKALLFLLALLPSVLSAQNRLVGKDEATTLDSNDWVYIDSYIHDVRKFRAQKLTLNANNLSDLGSVSTALTNLGGTTIGKNLFKTSPALGTIMYPQVNADGSVSWLTASALRTAIGAGEGEGELVVAWGDIAAGTIADQGDLQAALNAKVDIVRQVNGHTLGSDVTVTKADVGLGNADNTSDANKPVSTAAQTAINLKADAVRQVNGHALNADVTVTKADVGLGNVPNTDATNAGNISSGFLAPDRLAPGTALQVFRRNAGNTAGEFVTLAAGGDMLKTDNLSGLTNFATARTNLSLDLLVNVDNTNANNLSSGTVPAARLPNPSASTLGGVQSAASTTHQFVNSISTAGVPGKAQPAFSDLSGAALDAQLPTSMAGKTLTGDTTFERLKATILNMGTVTGAGTATFTSGYSVAKAVFSGSTATIALPSTPTDGEYIVNGQNTSGGQLTLTFSNPTSLIVPEYNVDTAQSTLVIPSSSTGLFTLRFFVVGGSFVKVSAVGSLARSQVATVTDANAMGTLAIDVTKSLNTKTISAPATFTFSATPANTNTWFSLEVTNSSGSAAVATVPSSFNINGQATATTLTIAAGGTEWITWCYDGSRYVAWGIPAADTGTTTGSANAYVLTLNPVLSAYATNAKFRFISNFANTGAATLNISGLGAVTIKKAAGGITTDLVANDIRSGQVCEVVYDGTNFQLTSAVGNAGSSTDSAAIHTTGSSEISGMTPKGTPTVSDIIPISDEAASHAQKGATIANILAANDARTKAESNTTIDTASTNTIKRFDYAQFVFPEYGDGTNAVRVTAEGNTYGHFTYSNSTAKATNFVIYTWRVPDNWNSSVDPSAAFKFILGGADTGKHAYKISESDLADSAAAAAPTFANEIALSFAGDASGASGDVESVALTTLTGWGAALTAGHYCKIKVARDGSDGTLDTSTVNSTDANLTIRYAISSTSSQ